MRHGVVENSTTTGKSIAAMGVSNLSITGGGPLKLSLSLSSSVRRQSELNMPALSENSANQTATLVSPVKPNVLKLTLGRNKV